MGTVSEILEAICKHQGLCLEGEVQGSLEHAITELRGHLQIIAAVTSVSNVSVPLDSASVIQRLSDVKEALVAKRDAERQEIAGLKEKLSVLRERQRQHK